MKQLALLALAVTVAGTALAACTPSTPHFAFNAAERRGRLNSNGLKFVIMPDSTTRLVEVDVRYDVGSREDPIGKAGLAHAAEHMMFQLKPKGATSSPPMHEIGEPWPFFKP